TEAPRPMVYYSIDQLSLPVFNVVARTSGDPAALAEAMRRAVIDVRASILVTSQLALQEHVARSLDADRTWVAMMNGFSALALVLAVVGIYAAVSFTVERRTQELGIRVALGATYPRLLRMVLRQTLWIV